MKNHFRSDFNEILMPDIHHGFLKSRLVFHRFLPFVIFFLLFGCSTKNTKIYRIGILSGISFSFSTTDGYLEKMKTLGYIEGKNVEYDNWYLDDNPEEEERIIQKFIDDKVDLIMLYPSRASLLAKKLTEGTGIPVVFAGATIEDTNLVNNLHEPGGNVTGVRFPTPELIAKRVELLLELAPDVQGILIFYDDNYPSYTSTSKTLKHAIENTNVTLIEIPVYTVEETKSSLEILERSNDSGVDAIFLVADLLSASPEFWEAIKSYAIKHQIPVACNLAFQLEDPCLFMLGPSHYEIGTLAAMITDKILQGTPPSSIPIASPELNLYINYRWAQTLGLTIPEGLLKQAESIIR